MAKMENRGQTFRFGPFTLNTEERVLSRNGIRLRLQGQPYQILEILLARGSRLVTRDEIRDALWPGDTYVDFEHGLNTSVKKLRQILGDTPGNPSYIETVRGSGYRFVGPIEIVEAKTEEAEPLAPSAQTELPSLLSTEKLLRRASDVAPAIAAASEQKRRGLKPAYVRAALLLAALLVVFGAAGSFYLYRANQQSLRLTEEDTVLLADFVNTSGDPIFDNTLKTALRVSLRQSPFLNLLPDETVAQTLRLMTRPVGTKLTAEVARDLCMRAGSKAYIAGAIGSLGSEYVLELRAVNCTNQNTLAEEQVTAAAKEKVLEALGAAASRLRSKLGESLTTITKLDVPLEEATTSSLEALKALSIGTSVADEHDLAAALPWHLRAIELDPNFAMGYKVVGGDYYGLGEAGRASQYLTKAFELRQHTSEREELEIAAAYYRDVTGELEKSAQTLEQEIQSYPRGRRAYLTLASVFVQQGQYEKAAELIRQALPKIPSKDHYESLANCTLALQRLDETKQNLNDALALKGPDNHPLHETLYGLAFITGDSAAIATQQRWFASRPKFENFGLALASDTEAYAGHLEKARELTRQAVNSAVSADSNESGAIWEAIAAQREAAYGNRTEAKRMAVEALKLAPTSESLQSEAALAFAMAGDAAHANSLTQDLGKRFPLNTQIQSIWLPTINAQSALAHGNPDAALSALQPTSSMEFGQTLYTLNISCLYPAYVRGEAYLAARQGTAAAAEFQKILDHSGITWNCWTGSLAGLGVARANALQAKSAQGPEADAARIRSLAAYKEFLTRWKDADADIPILKEAKAEYAKLR